MDNLKLFIVLCIGCAIPLVFLIREKIRNERNLKQLKIRVNVNGIRGKSTITRLITSILREAGYHVVGKTTGTAARMMYWNQEEEEEIKRLPRGVSIGEQIRVVNKAAKAGADALVCECMAVRPDYQKVYEHQILKGGIVVIVNVVEDHLDEMGPTLEQLAWAFGDTIPYKGIAVVPDCEFTEYFRSIAKKRKSKLVVVDPDMMPEEYLNQFPYKIFSNNCAMAISVARALGIDDEVSLRGMLKANPDPGALRIEHISNESLDTYLVNAFAANEPSSTLEIWDVLHKENLPLEEPVVVMNCRPDRVDRTNQFVRDCLPLLGKIHLVIIGEKAEPIERAYRKGKLPNTLSYHNLSNKSVPTIMQTLVPMLDGHILFCVGNIHGIGEDFLTTVHALQAASTAMQRKKSRKAAVEAIDLSAYDLPSTKEAAAEQGQEIKSPESEESFV